MTTQCIQSAHKSEHTLSLLSVALHLTPMSPDFPNHNNNLAFIQRLWVRVRVCAPYLCYTLEYLMFIIFKLNLLSLFSGVETRGAFPGDVTSVQTDNHESPTTTKPSCLLCLWLCLCFCGCVCVYVCLCLCPRPRPCYPASESQKVKTLRIARFLSQKLSG